MEQTTQESQPTTREGLAEAGQPRRFRLLRYFTITTLAAFAAVAATLVYLEHREGKFFEQVQNEQQAFMAKAQAELARQNEAAAHANLLAVHEAGHVALTRVVGNLLWASDFGPWVARAAQLPIEPCRAAPKATPERKNCFAEVGQRIRDLPGFQAIDAKAYQAMATTKVFKIKVWDLRGVTVYSSEHGQIGDYGADNLGWQAAVAGRPASELTHRDRFSAFEGIVENRDLISTYVPVYGKRDGKIMGVLELYSDVTPLLEQLRTASRRFVEIASTNEAHTQQAARNYRQKVANNSATLLLIVGALLVSLYLVSLLIVRIGQRIIDRQTLAQERAARREQLWHREKMAALSAMTANITHEVGNPLAVIAGVAEQLPDADTPSPEGSPGLPPAKTILEQTDRIASMMRQLSEFAAARSDSPEWVDINAMVKAVCDFFSFDQRYRGLRIDLRPAERLPAREYVPDHLNEVMMNLLEGAAECLVQRDKPLHIVVETAVRDDGAIIIRLGLPCLDAGVSEAMRLLLDERFEPARRRAHEMGGSLTLGAGAIEVALPPPQ